MTTKVKSFTAKKLSPELIRLIRVAKSSGRSLTDISRQYHVARSTISIYCRDLYDDPQRKYETEAEFRHNLVLKGKGKNHNKYHPCIDCGAKIRNNRTRCYSCNIEYQRMNGHIDKLISLGTNTRFGEGHTPMNRRRTNAEIVKDLILNPPKPKREKPVMKQNVKIEICPKSPIQRHHWMIDSKNLGTCKYCMEIKQF